MKKVRIISASFRPDSNSHALCEEAAIKGFVECFEGATLAGSVLADGIEELFASDVHYIESWGPEYHGLKAIKRWFADWNAKGKVLEWQIDRFFHSGDETVATWHFRWQMNGEEPDTLDGATLVRWSPNNRISFVQEFGCTTHRYEPQATI